MNFSFRQMRAFLAVARHASFTKAAEQLHISQAGLSAMVRDLETQLDCRLFERTTRAVRLTPAGQALLPVAQRAVHDLGAAVAQLGALGASGRDRLRVGVTPLIACSVIPEVLKRFHKLAPQLRVEVMDLDRSLIAARVESGDLDAGFGAFFTRVSGIRRRTVFPARLALAVPRLAGDRRRSVRWQQIDRDSLIALPDENPIQRLVNQHLGVQGDAPARVVTHLETVLAMVEAGLGQAVVPSFAAVASNRWQVRLVPVAPAVAVDYYCITRAGQGDSERIDTFVRCFGEVATAHMG
ncbi:MULTISPECIES: LysR family transcriptional regulator [Bordetella]|uniref:LysR family transcriptional regulator n=1 Tax=Bordetella genomosp. 2 TaxID=1983456 RepID=A0A261VEZ1_9BORD|nr:MULTISPECIES: LysR family transcriptional regulator [Bordetella]OZI72649.1 LysR family transcriptional regulator [Bordetella genomosp. 2]